MMSQNRLSATATLHMPEKATGCFENLVISLILCRHSVNLRLKILL